MARRPPRFARRAASLTVASTEALSPQKDDHAKGAADVPQLSCCSRQRSSHSRSVPPSVTLSRNERAVYARIFTAANNPEKRREIAARGGKSVPAEKRAFAVNPKLAAKAGHIGGQGVPNESRL